LSVRTVHTQARLGLEVNEAEADTLFDSWDLDSSGTLSIDELHKILRRGGKVRPAG
jgi:Ca2+-binding EF-hand superfamily protein